MFKSQNTGPSSKRNPMRGHKSRWSLKLLLAFWRCFGLQNTSDHGHPKTQPRCNPWNSFESHSHPTDPSYLPVWYFHGFPRSLLVPAIGSSRPLAPLGSWHAPPARAPRLQSSCESAVRADGGDSQNRMISKLRLARAWTNQPWLDQWFTLQTPGSTLFGSEGAASALRPPPLGCPTKNPLRLRRPVGELLRVERARSTKSARGKGLRCLVDSCCRHRCSCPSRTHTDTSVSRTQNSGSPVRERTGFG